MLARATLTLSIAVAFVSSAEAASPIACLALNSHSDHSLPTLLELAPSAAEGASMELLKLLDGPLSRRFESKTRSGDFGELRSQILNLAHNQVVHLQFKNEELKFKARLTLKNGVLEVTFPSIRIDGLRMQDTESKINYSFGKLIVATISGLRERLAWSPDGIKSVHIVGEEVINQPLIKRLKKLGFKRERIFRPRKCITLLSGVAFLAGCAISTVDPVAGSATQAVSTIAGVGAGATLAMFPEPSSWGLRLPIRRD